MSNNNNEKMQNILFVRGQSVYFYIGIKCIYLNNYNIIVYAVHAEYCKYTPPWSQ